MQYDERKSGSPNSIHFYLKKYEGNLDLANKYLSEYREKMRGKILSPATTKYWITKFNVSEDEAKKLVSEHQTKKAKIKKVNVPYDTEVKNLTIKHSCTIEEAKKIANERRLFCSPRLVTYWLNKGYNLEDSKKMVSEFQSLCSPRTLIYWIKNGYSYIEAKSKRAEYQDNISVTSIANRFNLSVDDAFDIQKDIYLNSKSFKADEYFGLYSIYKKNVVRLTEITFKAYSNDIENSDKRGDDYHLDHIVSIKDGFVNEIPAEIISCKFNLRIISQYDNCSKNFRSDMDIEKLIEKYNNEYNNKL